MTETYSTELYRQEGDNFRSVRLSVTADGSVRLDAQDMGKFVEEVWGDSDYEFGVDVPATALRKLVFSLLREKYAGRSGAVDEFRAFCKREDIRMGLLRLITQRISDARVHANWTESARGLDAECITDFGGRVGRLGLCWALGERSVAEW